MLFVAIPAKQAIGGLSMTRHFAKLAIVALVGGVLSSRPASLRYFHRRRRLCTLRSLKGLRSSWLSTILPLSAGPLPTLAGTMSISQSRIMARSPVT